MYEPINKNVTEESAKVTTKCNIQNNAPALCKEDRGFQYSFIFIIPNFNTLSCWLTLN